MSVSQSSLSVVFDRTGKPVVERDVDQSIGFGVTRNTHSAHSKFSENTHEQRQMIIAEYCEKMCQHELQAAHAEKERRILREE